jgi:hypothetical protein
VISLCSGDVLLTSSSLLNPIEVVHRHTRGLSFLRALANRSPYALLADLCSRELVDHAERDSVCMRSSTVTLLFLIVVQHFRYNTVALLFLSLKVQHYRYNPLENDDNQCPWGCSKVLEYTLSDYVATLSCLFQLACFRARH